MSSPKKVWRSHIHVEKKGGSSSALAKLLMAFEKSLLGDARVGLVRGVGIFLSSSNKRYHFGAGRRVCQLELNQIVIHAL